MADRTHPPRGTVANRAINETEVLTGIYLANTFPDIVVAINVGNETLVDWNDHSIPIERLIQYLRQVRADIDQPVTTAENYVALVRFAKQLRGELDFVAVHTYSVWEGYPLATAMADSIRNFSDVQSAYPDTPIAIVEAGWASVASDLGELASETNQAQQFRDLSAWSQSHHVTVFCSKPLTSPGKAIPTTPMERKSTGGPWIASQSP